MKIITKKYREVLKEKLIGVYLHGSSVFGCCSEKSDLDFIAVVSSELTLEEKENLIEILLENNKFAPQKGFEMSVVLFKDCRHFSYPTPYELHYSNRYYQQAKQNLTSYCKEMSGVDYDLAAHFTVIKNIGIVLTGKEINSVFGEIPWEYYLDSIYRDVQDSQQSFEEQPLSVLLNLCRTWAAVQDKKILSKAQGADWVCSVDSVLSKEDLERLKEVKQAYLSGNLLDATSPELKNLMRQIEDIVREKFERER